LYRIFKKPALNFGGVLVNSIDERAQPMVALADGVMEFVTRWREAFLPGHCEYRGEDPGVGPLGLVGPLDHASLCLCSRIGFFETDTRGTYDFDVSLRVIRQCVAELWATEGRIWTGDVLRQFAFDGDGKVVCLPEADRPEIDGARHLEILEIHAARLLERAPALSTGALRRESSDEERDRFCYEERAQGRAWNRHARRLGLVMV
jgi:hypothetical protein